MPCVGRGASRRWRAASMFAYRPSGLPTWCAFGPPPSTSWIEGYSTPVFWLVTFFFLSHFIMGVDRRFRLCSARFRVVHLLSVLTEVSNGLVDGASCGLSEILEVCVGLIETSLYDCMALSDYTFVQMHARASRRKMNWLGILDTHVSITAFDHPSTSSANAAPCAGTSILLLGEAPLVPI